MKAVHFVPHKPLKNSTKEQIVGVPVSQRHERIAEQSVNVPEEEDGFDVDR